MVSIGIFIVSLICAAFFAATEVAFFSLTPLSVTRGNRKRLEKLFLNKNDIIAMLLTGNSLAIVCGTLALDALLPPEKELYLKIIAFFVELILFFLLSEALPKAIGRKKKHSFARKNLSGDLGVLLSAAADELCVSENFALYRQNRRRAPRRCAHRSLPFYL